MQLAIVREEDAEDGKMEEEGSLWRLLELPRYIQKRKRTLGVISSFSF